MRIGILGGTFDPIHQGHLALAEAALHCLALDEVLFIPANRNPAKTVSRAASARDRLEMVKRAIESQSKYSVSDIEIGRGGPSFAVDTLLELHHVRPGDYWFLMGSDAAKDIETWKNPEKLLRLCRLGVAIRPPENWENLVSRVSPETASKMDPVHMEPTAASATEIRERLRKKQPIGDWLPPRVLQYIRDHHLYEN